jgi:hypothetical protein
MWTAEELGRFGGAEEVRIAGRAADGTLRKPVTVWIVRDGDDLFVRSVNGPTAAWFRGALARHEGRIWASDVEKDVTFHEVDDGVRQDNVDAAYRAKYRRYPSIVPSIVTPETRATTLKLLPLG